ncbi:MAG: chemotaxis protein CheB, partial [Polaromonas sp.]|nr:chemotaxis protein CheB [Polaromonas sp.]
MTSAATADLADPPHDALRIVGIGASAGGLAALEEFLGQVPPDSGMAYMVVQHLDPTQKAMLAELLQRITPMPVREAKNGQQVVPNHVYVIPPNAELSLNGGLLRLATPSEPRGMRLPINILFSSLASAQGERAIAVVLSGMGSDGTLGLQAVKAVGGLILVQQPDTAQFDSMPLSAIASGCVDFVAPPAALPGHILNYIARLPGQPRGDAEARNDTAPETGLQGDSLEEIFKLLQARTRHDFSNYKPN